MPISQVCYTYLLFKLYKCIMDESNRYLLCRRRSKVVISSAKPEDSGRYECVAESTSGHRASLAAQLLVAHDTRIPETSEYPPSLFLLQTYFIFSFSFYRSRVSSFRRIWRLNKKREKERERYIYIYLLFIPWYKSVCMYTYIYR